jgi:tetratricopeptide (TPR) repeat protein
LKRKKTTPLKITICILLALLIGLIGIYLVDPEMFSPSAQNETASSSPSAENPAENLSPESPPASSPVIDTPLSTDQAAAQKALALYEQGLKLYYERNFSAALTYFDQALALNQNCYQALNAKGATYAFQGRYDEGIALIKQALALQPEFVYGHFNLGLANELAGRWETAINAYQEALRLDNKDVWSYYGIASIYGRLGNAAKVKEYLAQAIALDPGVKEVAREEHDFDPVRQDPAFQELVAPAP